jgi:hypothetical protein
VHEEHQEHEREVHCRVHQPPPGRRRHRDALREQVRGKDDPGRAGGSEEEVHAITRLDQPQRQAGDERQRQQHRRHLGHGDLHEITPLLVGLQQPGRPHRHRHQMAEAGVHAQPHEQLVLARAPHRRGQAEDQRPVPVARDRLVERAAVADPFTVEPHRGIHAEAPQVHRLRLGRGRAWARDAEAVPAVDALLPTLGRAPGVGQRDALPPGCIERIGSLSRRRYGRVDNRQLGLPQEVRVTFAHLEGLVACRGGVKHECTQERTHESAREQQQPARPPEANRRGRWRRDHGRLTRLKWAGS